MEKEALNKRMPDTYEERDGCHNCLKAFVVKEYDEPNYYYCTEDAPERPPCGSVRMKECPQFFDISEEEERILINAWDEWSESREVMAWGFCRRWEKKHE